MKAGPNPLVGCSQLHGVGAAGVAEEAAFGLQKEQAQWGSFPFSFFN